LCEFREAIDVAAIAAFVAGMLTTMKHIVDNFVEQSRPPSASDDIWHRSVGIVGAGPAGLTAAYQLLKLEHRVEVFEAGEAVGGMAKTIPLWGQLVDLGPHRFFSSDPRVNTLWLEVVGRDYSMVRRLTRIYYNGRFFAYPLQPFNALSGLGIWESLRCVFSYLLARWTASPEGESFEHWVTSRFGRRLFNIFFKSYSEKLWGIDCRELDADFAAQRIKKLSLMEAIKAALTGPRDSKHRTLADEFAYPHQGAGTVYERMAQRIRERGGIIRLQCPITAAYPAGADRPALRFTDGSLAFFDHVISTMPLTTLVDQLAAPVSVRRHAQALTFRNTILVYLEIDGASPFPDQWI